MQVCVCAVHTTWVQAVFAFVYACLCVSEPAATYHTSEEVLFRCPKMGYPQIIQVILSIDHFCIYMYIYIYRN